MWWPLPLAVLLWLLIIWAFGFFMSKSEKEVAISIPDAIEAEFFELPEPGQLQKPAVPPRKGVETQPEQMPQPAPALKTPPPPRPRPLTVPQPPPPQKQSIETAKALPQQKKNGTQPKVTQQTDRKAPADLSEYIQRKQAQSRPTGIFDGVENAPNRHTQPQPTAEEIRLARVKRNLQTPGTSGVFQILEIRLRYARFSFRAWTTDVSNPRRVVIEVEAGPDEDIERAVIRRMIQLIREYHQEDFNWESRRLNRIIVLSARPRDSEGLENFLMREFFGEPLSPYMQ